jgi:DNA-binding CsgD family transcriptional regulator
MANVLEEAFIDRIYDAAARPELWNRLLVEIADMMQSAGGAAFGMLMNGQGSAFCHYGRYEPPQDHRLSGRHMLNPWTRALQRAPVGRVLSSHEIIPSGDLHRTEFYADILAPEKLEHCVITTVGRSNTVNFAFNIMRGDQKGPYTEREIAKLNAIMPHLRRSAQLRLNLESYQALSLRQQQILDQINTGIVLLDEAGQFHCVNKAAEEIFCADNGLALVANSLVTRDGRITRRLSHLIEATAAGGSGGSMSVPRSDTMLDPMLILVCPLRGTIRDALSAPGKSRQVVALFIKDPRRGFSGLDHILMPLFRLTKAEIRVALALGSGETMDVTASQLGISRNTVKTHAKRVYEKMGVANQAELVRNIARLAAF